MSLFMHKSKNEENRLLAGDPRDPRYIASCLELARDLRVCLHLDFVLNRRQISQLRSVCVAVEGRHFVVCLLEDVPRLPPAGMETQVYFTVRGGRRSVPCSFTTRLESLRRERGGQYMTFPMPDVMEHNQRRFNVRIDVEKESIPGFSVWHGALSSGGDSSGGLRLDVRDTCREYPRLLPRELLMVKGDFSLPDKPPLPLSMVGSIVRINVSERQRLKSLAVRFQRWLQTRDDRNVWLKVDEQGGVPAVGVWIFHILLERNRLIRAEQ